MMRGCPSLAGVLTLLLTAGAVTAGADVRLVEAVKHGNAPAMRALLRRHANVNTPAVDGTTALHWAAFRENVPAAEALIRAGADVRAATPLGVTPLSLACATGNAAMVAMLLNAGASPNAALPEGETALLTASRTGSVAVVTLLLEHGAVVTAKERWRGQDALAWAAAEGHLAVARLLVEHGADVNSRSASGFTPLLFAARQGDPALVTLLLDAGARVNETADPDGRGSGASALIAAIYNGHWDLATLLLERGADPNISTAGYTPLHLALQVRNPDEDRNPDLDQTARTGTTGAVGSLGVIKALLASGADPDAQMTGPFVDLGSPPDMPLMGATPFFLAAKGADVAVLRLLVANGVRAPLRPTAGGTTPLMAAAGVGYQQGRSTGTERDALEAVQLISGLGADVNATNAFGYTALHGAVIRGANSVVQFLVDRGIALDTKDRKGRTALTIAEFGAGDSQQRRQLATAALLRTLTAAGR